MPKQIVNAADSTPATERQVQYVSDLLDDAVITVALQARIKRALSRGLTFAEAQEFIPALQAAHDEADSYVPRGNWFYPEWD